MTNCLLGKCLPGSLPVKKWLHTWMVVLFLAIYPLADTCCQQTTGVVHPFTLPCFINALQKDISGEYYDYTKTYTPERPYIIKYDKTLTMKMYLAQPDEKGGSTVFITFEQALQNIRQIDQITSGIPKIVYLVGWQYNGHDDGYPAWHEVNRALKRDKDTSALQSFLWLRDEAKKYNTIISVHINMTDAYDNSPLWDTYIKNDLIGRKEDGSYYILSRANDTPNCYYICYTREWQTGFAQKRIDHIIGMLQLQLAGTVHLDAFFPRTSAYHGITQDMETRTMRKIFRYWRDKGIDVTSEQQARMRPDPFIGLQPMAWWFDLSREQQATIPQHLACGGMSYKPNDDTTGFLFGQCMHGEDLFGTFGITNFVPDFKKQFCTTTLQTYYQNLHTFLAYDKDHNTTNYSGGLTITAKDMTVTENGRLVRSYNDVFITAAWKKDKEILAFSEKGYRSKEWTLPPAWKGVKAVDVYTVTEKGLVLKVNHLSVSDMSITLSLEAMEEVAIQPAHK
jgi:hypothetical protein